MASLRDRARTLPVVVSSPLGPDVEYASIAEVPNPWESITDAVTREVVAPAPSDVPSRLPYNAVTGVEYKGGNILRLASAEAENGYSGAGWAGFKQWLTVGRVVRKGEHGTACQTVVRVGADEHGQGGTTKPRGFRVFHYDQTQELTKES